MLLAPIPCGFRSVLDTETGQPTAAVEYAAGTLTADASQATKSTYAQQFGGAISKDAYGIRVFASYANAAATGRVIMLDVGVDPAGGSSYTTVIENLMLGATGTSVGCEWFFPLFIRSGSTVALRFQWEASDAVSFNPNVRLQLLMEPTAPERWALGQYCETLGAVTATTEGVNVTAGTDVYGTWTSIGTLAKPCWYVTPSVAYSKASWTNLPTQNHGIELGVGDGTSGGTRVISRYLSVSNTSENMTPVMPPLGYTRLLPAGSTIYARARNVSSPRTFEVIAHCVGG